MPIFEYRCQACQHVSAYIEKAGITGEHECKACGSKQTEKILSTFSTPAKSMSTNSGGGCSGGCSTGNCPLA